ncbi:hypothetical protein AVEN_261672-1 [Araneus ventricosus]|uniref:Uncharacterized protein n=1 Tax=Araneus ventricosus TaxID=182803 RepID=A0A4Y2DUV8_ARAVE|nr:hypothetical protein AVEN_261672-1 [Araneus ventricosus]
MLSTLKKDTKIIKCFHAVVLLAVILRSGLPLLLLIRPSFLFNGNASSTSSLDAFAWNSSHFKGPDAPSPEEKSATEDLAKNLNTVVMRFDTEVSILFALTVGYIYESMKYKIVDTMLSVLNNRGNSMVDNLSCVVNTILSGATRSHFIDDLFMGTLNAITVTMCVMLTEMRSDQIFTAVDDIEFIETIDHRYTSSGVAECRKITLKSPFYNIDGLILLFYCYFVSIFCIYSYISLLWSTFLARYPTRKFEILRKKCPYACRYDLLLVVVEL